MNHSLGVWIAVRRYTDRWGEITFIFLNLQIDGQSRWRMGVTMRWYTDRR
jgi:hypothetical protein